MSETLDYRQSSAPRSEAEKLDERQAAMARQQAEIERQQASLAEAQADLAAQQMAMASEQAKLEAMAQAGQVVWIKSVTIEVKKLAVLSLSARDAAFPIAEAKLGDRVYVHRNGRPKIEGVVVAPLLTIEGTGFVPEDKKVEVYYLCPVLGIAQTLTIPLTLIGYRAATV